MLTTTDNSFLTVKKQVRAQFDKLAQQDKLFYVSMDREKVWDEYLSGFTDPIEKQGHNCNCCKSFLRQFGGIVAIIDGKMVSIWDDVNVGELFEPSINNLRKYIHSLPITDVFFNDFAKCGTDRNLDKETGTTWNHFYIELPRKFVLNINTIPTKKGELRDNKQVFKRSLDELSQESVETVLELIAQNSLYRGKEFESMLKEFLSWIKVYNELAHEDKDNFCWVKSAAISPALSRIRNTAIGTLLIDLSGGMELDDAVTRFEKVLAPTNYKRPTALVTPNMVAKAKERIIELGYEESLNRRFAEATDVKTNNVIFVDKSSTITDVFDEIAKDAFVNPKTLTKVEEISMEDFIEKIVPNSKKIEVLLENRHLNNFVSLLTGPEPTMFKWNNPFSWSYTGGITDSIKERVKAAGGNVNGVLRTSLSWHNSDDLDLHVVEPSRNMIYFGSKISGSSGTLDVDMNAGGRMNSVDPVENIVWTDANRMQDGKYTVFVNNFNKRGAAKQGYTIQVEFGGEIFEFSSNKNGATGEKKAICEITYSRANGFKIWGEAKSILASKDKWGLKTNTYVKVRNIMYSPNHWEGAIGNKHYLFFLDGCISDEAPRPFFNEYLKEELSQDRKVFEVLGSKIKVENNPNQLSGIGLSETQKGELIVRVEGKFKRNLKITIK